MNPRIKMRHLSAFAEVARCRSVTKAARALFVTQSAVSRSLGELEEILGAQLLRRDSREISLTRIGESFLRYAEQGLAKIGQGEEMVARAQEGRGFEIAVGILPYIAAHIASPVICGFMRDNPALVLRVMTRLNLTMLAMLKSGELDLVIGRLASPTAMKGVNFEHLYSDRIALVTHPEHPLQKGRRGKGQKDRQKILREVGNHAVILLPSGTGVRDLMDRMFIQNSAPLPARQMETESATLAREMVLDGDAVWCAPLTAVAGDLKTGKLAEIHMDMSETYSPVGMSVRADFPISPECETLMEKVREVMKNFWVGKI